MINLHKILANFNGNLGASLEMVRSTETALALEFPIDYVSFLTATNGGEGMIGDTYIMLWPVEELEELNAACEVKEFAPELLLIGSNGGAKHLHSTCERTLGLSCACHLSVWSSSKPSGLAPPLMNSSKSWRNEKGGSKRVGMERGV
jgi:hypothetical protein